MARRPATTSELLGTFRVHPGSRPFVRALENDHVLMIVPGGLLGGEYTHARKRFGNRQQPPAGTDTDPIQQRRVWREAEAGRLVIVAGALPFLVVDVVANALLLIVSPVVRRQDRKPAGCERTAEPLD